MVLAAAPAGGGTVTESDAIYVGDLPAYDISNNSPVWLGQALMAVIEGSLFMIMIGAYFYLRISVDVWPPPGDQLPHVTTATLAFIPLALSCLCSWWASEGAKKNSRRQMLSGLISNVLLALVFLGFQAVAWHSLNFKWSADVHASVVWAILFLHTFDAVGDILFTVVLIVILALGRYGPKQRIGVHVDSVLWYFIAGIWLPLYVVIYWGPRFAGTP
jgi:cytochrome c oxidase subunit I+III